MEMAFEMNGNVIQYAKGHKDILCIAVTLENYEIVWLVDAFVNVCEFDGRN